MPSIDIFPPEHSLALQFVISNFISCCFYEPRHRNLYLPFWEIFGWYYFPVLPVNMLIQFLVYSFNELFPFILIHVFVYSHCIRVAWGFHIDTSLSHKRECVWIYMPIQFFLKYGVTHRNCYTEWEGGHKHKKIFPRINKTFSVLFH